MEIYGREYGFKLTVGASSDISEFCPDGDIKRVGEVLSGGFAKTVKAGSAFVCALSRGYEEARSFEEPGYVPAPLTPEIMRSLDMDTYRQVMSDAMSAFVRDQKTTVEVEPAKKNEGAGAGA